MKIIFVTGYPKSGSTILGNILNEAQGIFHAGEVFHMWKKGLSWTDSLVEGKASAARTPNRHLTGAEKHFTEDPIWGEAWQRAARYASNERPARPAELATIYQSLYGLHARVFRHDSKAAFFRIDTSRRGDPAARRFADYCTELYEGLGERSESRVIVDTSKRPSFARFVASLKGVEAYFVHVVRDPRAVAYSRQKKRKEMQGDGTAELDRAHLVRVLVKWALVDLEAGVLGSELGPRRYLRVRYEDFARRPRQVLRDVLEHSGEEEVRLPFVGERTVELKENHAVGGNTNRGKRGPIEIRESKRWQREMQPFDRGLCTTLSFPYLLKYNFLTGCASA